MATWRFEGLRMSSNASPALGCWVTKFHKPARSATPHGSGLAQCELNAAARAQFRRYTLSQTHSRWGMRCPAAKSRRPGHPLRRQAAKGNGSLVKSFRLRGFGKNARTGETHTQEPWFFMASWHMASGPVCTALFTILGGAVNRASSGGATNIWGV